MKLFVVSARSLGQSFSMRWAGTIFLVLSLSACAAEAAEGFQLIHSIKKWSELPKNLSVLRKSIAPASSKMGCTSFMISQFGHYITALHCIRECLLANHLIESKNIGGYPYEIVKNRTPDAHCDGAKITFLGAGMVTFGLELKQSESEHQYGETELKELQQDFAILQFPNSKGTPTWPCIKSREAPVGAGEKVWSIGYPEPTPRPNRLGVTEYGFWSDYISRGYVYDSILSVPIPHEELWTDEGRRNELEARMEIQIHLQTLIASDVDMNSGMSGGPWLDQDGRAFAVAVMGAHVEKLPGLGYPVIAYSGAYPLAEAKVQMTKFLGQKATDNAFRCQK